MKFIILFIFFFTFYYSLNAQALPAKKDPINPAILQKMAALSKRRETKLLGTPLIGFTGLQLDSTIYDVANAKGKLLFIHFWDAKNPMSIAQMDGMYRLHKKLKDSTNIEFITITYEDAKTIAQCQNMYNMPYRIITMSKEKCLAIKQENNVPTNIIVDKKGIIRYMKCGGDLDADIATQIIIGRMYPELLSIYKND
jgi:AhpC/TSA family